MSLIHLEGNHSAKRPRSGTERQEELEETDQVCNVTVGQGNFRLQMPKDPGLQRQGNDPSLRCWCQAVNCLPLQGRAFTALVWQLSSRQGAGAQLDTLCPGVPSVGCRHFRLVALLLLPALKI
ncbi:spectrin beta chain, non-erythrocytic 1 [Platysternon megacephalum]|uniref:Spectrin beta chain, non-erythrocytic 1 n=1 Tax=Platysternon megacephalum TaxID=55544 RepID=A0A4D9E1U7_9SAUR|nr:spectrin beta chain, non-erythrocytic 1 [Platysternon megacephalum]